MRTTYFPFYKTFRKTGLFLYPKHRSVPNSGTSERKTDEKKKDVSYEGSPVTGTDEEQPYSYLLPRKRGRKGFNHEKKIKKSRRPFNGCGIGIDRRAWGGAGCHTIRGSAA